MTLQTSVSNIRRHIQGPAARGTPPSKQNVGLLDCGALSEGPPDLLRVGNCAGPHCTLGEALSQTALAEDGGRDSALLLACDGRCGLRYSPAHSRFVKIRGRAAYVHKQGTHSAARRSRE